MSTAEKTNWKPLITIIFSMIMMYITSFGINVLIGPIVKDLGWSVSGLQFVIVAASLVSGTLMVTSGRLGDKIGKKKIFLLGSIIYTIGLIVVVLSPTSTIFSIAWALIWPFGMVLVIPTSVALIMHFYHGAQRATAFGIYGAVLSVISAFGPLLLGVLANEFGWRIALALSPAFGVITIILAFGLPETSKDSSIKIDITSVLLSVGSFGMFLIATLMASNYGWLMAKRPFVLGGTEISLGGLSIVPFVYVFAILLMYLFVKRGNQLSKKGEAPLLNVSILKNASFTIGMIVQGLLYFLIAAVIFVISVFVQAASGFDSLDTALTTLPASLGVAVFALFTPGLGQKIAPKWLIIFGFILIFLGIYFLGADTAVVMTPWTILKGTILFGVGCGLVMGQIATITMLRVKPEENGEASGLSETMKEIIGQGFAIAFAGSVLFGAVYTNMAEGYAEVEFIVSSDQDKEAIIVELEDTFMEITPDEEKMWVANELPEKTKAAYNDIIVKSSEGAFSKTMWMLNVFVLISILLSFFLPGDKLSKNS